MTPEDRHDGRDWRRAVWRLRYVKGGMAASHLRRLGILATHRHCRIEFRGPVRLGPGFSLWIPDNGTFIVGSGVDFRRGFVCEISGDGVVEIGDGSIFTSHALIQCTTSIRILPGSIFGQDTMIADGSHRFRDPEVPILAQGYDFRPITIGPGALIHAKCTIVANIGEHAVIGANSLVNRDIPAYCFAAGVPARVIDRFAPAGYEAADA